MLKKILLILPLFLLSNCLYSEKLTFSIDYLGFSVASVDFIKEHIEMNNIITVNAKSSGFINFFAQSLDNKYIARNDHLYRPIQYLKDIDQRDFEELSATTYDFINLSADYYDKVSQLSHTYPIQHDTKDFFTALYYLRTMNLKEEHTFTIDSAGKIWTIMCRYIKSEQLKSPVGTFQTNKVELSFKQFDDGKKLKGDMLTNNLVNEANVLSFWFTDDENQIPVKAQYVMKPFNVNWTIRKIQ